MITDARITRPLSERHLEVLRLAAHGYTAQQIGSKLFISFRTVRAHLREIRDRLGAQNTTHAVAICIARGLLRYNDEEAA